MGEEAPAGAPGGALCQWVDRTLTWSLALMLALRPQKTESRVTRAQPPLISVRALDKSTPVPLALGFLEPQTRSAASPSGPAPCVLRRLLRPRCRLKKGLWVKPRSEVPCVSLPRLP